MIKIEDCKVGMKAKIVAKDIYRFYTSWHNTSRWGYITLKLFNNVECYITNKIDTNTVEVRSDNFCGRYLFDIKNLVEVEDKPIKKDNDMTYSIGMIFESSDNDLYVLQKYSNNIFLACLDGRWFGRGICHSGDIYKISQEDFDEISKSTTTTFKLKYLNVFDMLTGKEYVKPCIKRKVVYEETTEWKFESEEDFNNYQRDKKFIRFVD